MIRNKRKDEEVFYDHIEALIKNLLVTNINYKNGYYANKSTFDVIADTQERGEYILGQLEQTKHLIGIDKL